MSRREIRDYVFQLLFRAEFHEREEMPQQAQFFFEELGPIEEKDAAYIKEKSENILGRIEELDAMVNQVAQGWKTSRMGKVDLTLIRLAVHEMIFEEDIPEGVAINEAVELAKIYGSDDSPSFINGVLAKLT